MFASCVTTEDWNMVTNDVVPAPQSFEVRRTITTGNEVYESERGVHVREE